MGEASERDAVIKELEEKLAELQAGDHEGVSASVVAVTQESDEARALLSTVTQVLLRRWRPWWMLMVLGVAVGARLV